MDESDWLIRGNQVRGAQTGQQYGACVLLKIYAHPVTVSRRKALTLRFAMIAAERLTRAFDPNCV